MDVPTLIAAAERHTGLSDLGDTRILAGLHKLVDALNTEADLTENGRRRFETNIVNALANRLRVEDYLQKHPELLQRPTDRPMFVFGLPRTGTTLAAQQRFNSRIKGLVGTDHDAQLTALRRLSGPSDRRVGERNAFRRQALCHTASGCNWVMMTRPVASAAWMMLPWST